MASSEAEILEWCVVHLRTTIDDPAIAVAPDIPFARMGLDSAKSVYFIVELEEWLGIELAPDILADHPTIADLASHLAART